MTLGEAITGVETSLNSYTGAVALTGQDQQIAAGIQTKLDAATAQVAVDQKAQSDAAGIFNSALDVLIEAATAAKVAV